MTNRVVATLIVLFTSFTTFAAGSPEKGKELITSSLHCAGCHGLTGNGRSTGAFPTPMLAGQPAAYIAMRLRQYRDGVLIDQGPSGRDKMEDRVRGLSDQDIEDIATYFEIQKRY